MFKSIMQKIEEKKAALVRKSIVAINNKQAGSELLTVVVLSAGAVILSFLFISALKDETNEMTNKLAAKIEEIFAFTLKPANG